MANDIWELIDTDATSGRQIFKRDASSANKGQLGTYDFAVSADFEVRDSLGSVLLTTSGTGKGDHWCGVFLWFVEGSDGRQVTLDASNKPDQILDVNDTPIDVGDDL